MAEKETDLAASTVTALDMMMLMEQMGRTIATASADAALTAHEKLNPHENRHAPGVSAFNPAGERDHPKLPLKCQMFWHGHREDQEQLRPDEIELFNRVPFTTKKYGQFTVKAEGDDVAGYRLYFDLGVRTLDERNALPSMRAILRQIVDGVPAS